MNALHCNRPHFRSRVPETGRIRTWRRTLRVVSAHVAQTVGAFFLAVRALLGAALLVASALAPASVAHASLPTVLVVGDSLSAGYGLASGQGWVDLLQKKLKATGYTHKVVNASITGDTTAGGRSRIGAALQAHKPHVVIIELGGNDGLRGAGLAQVKANLDYMVAAAEKAGARVLLLGMQLPPNYGPRYVGEFSAIFGDIAASRKVPLVPFLLEGFGDKPEMFQSDRIHPTAQAQPLMLELVWPALSRLLADKR